MDLATAGHAQLLLRGGHADGGQDAQAVHGGRIPFSFQWGAVKRHEEIDRNGVGSQVALHGVHAVGVGVGGADVLVVRFGGVEVVVIGVHAGRAQALGLAILEFAQAGTDLHVRVSFLEVLDHRGDALDVLVGKAAAGGHHAHARGAAVDTNGGLLEGFFGVDRRVFEDVGLGTEALRSIGAILRAHAGFEVDQVIYLHSVAKVVAPQGSGRVHEGEGLRVAGVGPVLRVGVARDLAGGDLGQVVVDGVGARGRDGEGGGQGGDCGKHSKSLHAGHCVTDVTGVKRQTCVTGGPLGRFGPHSLGKRNR